MIISQCSNTHTLATLHHSSNTRTPVTLHRSSNTHITTACHGRINMHTITRKFNPMPMAVIHHMLLFNQNLMTGLRQVHTNTMGTMPMASQNVSQLLDLINGVEEEIRGAVHQVAVVQLPLLTVGCKHLYRINFITATKTLQDSTTKNLQDSNTKNLQNNITRLPLLMVIDHPNSAKHLLLAALTPFHRARCLGAGTDLFRLLQGASQGLGQLRRSLYHSPNLTNIL
mmetsp:Transcript_5645/g.8675  ORF Transcript_5645/g.8675 Transcript_5645/m.8675 type:complete len:227 (+) Transcript_5645:1886-2566(+)